MRLQLQLLMIIMLFLFSPVIRVSYCDTQTHYFEISYGSAAPDNYVDRKAILINGKAFGPTIWAKSYDRLVIYVSNRLDHGFTMHWHGLHMRTSQRFDGVPGVTQQAIPPDSSFRYDIDINEQHGTYMYHAHTRLDILWVYGLLIVDDTDVLAQNDQYYYDDERHIVVSQYWHRSADALYQQVISRNFTGLSTGDSILINGRSYGVWNKRNRPANNDDIGYTVISVERNKIYRLRWLNIGDNTAFKCTIRGHRMTIIESDETITNPVPTSYLQIDIAQRYSTLLRTDKKADNYIIKCDSMPTGGPDNGVAILHYEGASDPTPLRTVARPRRTPNTPLKEWVLHSLPPSSLVRQRSFYPVPKNVDREILIDLYDVNINDFYRFTVSDEHFLEQKINLLQQSRSGVDINQYPAVYTVEAGQVVQIIFQNNYLITGRCIDHPFHVHGHTFYVVGYGSDKYNPKRAKEMIDENIRYKRYQFRDVTSLSTNRTNRNALPCGWVAIRFIANNPGVWIIHCHVTYHMILGMKFVLNVNDFRCANSGRFADPVDCNVYYECRNKSNRLMKKRFSCRTGFAYDNKTKRCREAKKFNNICRRTGIAVK